MTLICSLYLSTSFTPDNIIKLSFVISLRHVLKLSPLLKQYVSIKSLSSCFRCKECNSSVIFDDPSDAVYLYHLAEETPLLYAKLALKANGLQDYVNAMNEFN